MTSLLKLILAHLIADFFLQPKAWVKAKRQNVFTKWQLYIHALIHGLLSFIFVAEWWFLPWALAITVSHLLVDAAKSGLQKQFTEHQWFFADQAAHLAFIFLFWYLIKHPAISFAWINSYKVWLTATALFLLTLPASISISHLMKRWTAEIEDDSVKKSGKYIGIIERLLMFVFILYNQWAAIGLLITAKSVLRFGDLKNEKERIMTEYIILGTLLSLLCAVVITIGFMGMLKYGNI
jgi:hypothetical protein